MPLKKNKKKFEKVLQIQKKFLILQCQTKTTTTMNAEINIRGNVKANNEIEFQNFVATCKNAAIEADCDLVINYYDLTKYGRADWWQAAFVVDKFGGIIRLVSSVEDGKAKGNGTLAEALKGLAADTARLREIRSTIEIENID